MNDNFKIYEVTTYFITLVSWDQSAKTCCDAVTFYFNP